ncbi:hypothetical protein PR048_012178 [Dryococelus australis]|uniref:Uncharacterized protein n=1 Tax=Dryococelus australis TaxID=614101 RepID=A0ABQ9HNS0_9NEOP|nr:hypothetical protein PR048_012178 [Dryococelus australis]
MKGRGEQEIPEKIPRTAASSGTIPTCENQSATSPGIEPGSPSRRLKRGAAQLTISPDHIPDNLKSQWGRSEVGMEQSRNARVSEMGNPRENPPTSGMTSVWSSQYRLLLGRITATQDLCLVPSLVMQLCSGCCNSQQGEPGSIPRRVRPGFSHVGIVPDGAAGRRVSSGISRFPRRFIPVLPHVYLVSPTSALKERIGVANMTANSKSEAVIAEPNHRKPSGAKPANSRHVSGTIAGPEVAPLTSYTQPITGPGVCQQSSSSVSSKTTVCRLWLATWVSTSLVEAFLSPAETSTSSARSSAFAVCFQTNRKQLALLFEMCAALFPNFAAGAEVAPSPTPQETWVSPPFSLSISYPSPPLLWCTL